MSVLARGDGTKQRAVPHSSSAVDWWMDIVFPVVETQTELYQLRRSGVGVGLSQRSDLSRVSMAIRNELHGAEWKIERRNIELGKRLGKGGFGAPSSFIPPPIFVKYYQNLEHLQVSGVNLAEAMLALSVSGYGEGIFAGKWACRVPVVVCCYGGDLIMCQMLQPQQ